MSVCSVGRFLAIGLIASLPAATVHATVAPLQLLTRMFEARRTVSYEGDFVYLQNGQMTTLHIVRQVGKHTDQEHISTLDGPVREVVRHQGQATCTLPTGQSVVLGGRPISPGALQHIDEITAYYDLRLGKNERIAGRNAQSLEVYPRDDLRYGHRFWLDLDTGLLLKSELLGKQGDVLERVLFIRMSLVTEPVDPVESKESKVVPAQTTQALANAGSVAWTVGQLPAGFRLEEGNQQDTASTQQFVYSDGLATVSVFVERVPADRETMRGLSRRGALNIYSTRYRDWQVTIVGEVPEATVTRMGTSFHLHD